MGIFRRRTRNAEHSVEIVFDDEGARRLYRGETTHRVSWADLERVALRTTDDGPFAEDLFWVLVGSRGTGFVIPSSLIPHGMVERLQQLPGFDNEAVIQAMQSVTENVFVAWRRPV
ncbi:hypothetical protein [Nocardioides marmorisolisilvae]|uniref:Uncharacterized protein n=1 Tax=Nocardioides marmorisolisilvae TaxID=1542737 RepID=A0A3N0DZK3_9ACTN|nr:hypothetical protein [Nocardioides marmorisolisilvae]RNL80913.1 hypothetical protein EFL95_00545 [Nocardioides marmorisolisilvae]